MLQGVCFFLSAVLTLCGNAQTREPSGQLPIDLPRSAKVEFEADAPASKLVPLMVQLLSPNGFGDSPSGTNSIPIKTPLGSINVDPKDMANLLRPIKELHIVIYTEDRTEHAKLHYLHEFLKQGMKQVTVVSDLDSLLVMREPGVRGRYLAVLEQGNRVTAARTDGLPDLGSLGQFALERLTAAGEKMKRKIKL